MTEDRTKPPVPNMVLAKPILPVGSNLNKRFSKALAKNSGIVPVPKRVKK